MYESFIGESGNIEPGMKKVRGTCNIACMEENKTLVNPTERCRHPPIACMDCMRLTLKTSVDNANLEITCPETTCKLALTHSEL